MLEIYKMKTKLPHIGIFWVYKSTVLAKAMPLNSTEPDSLSLYDSDFSHLVEWEEHRIYLPCFPELIAVEYQEVSRGRIIYSTLETQSSLKYMQTEKWYRALSFKPWYVINLI